MDNIKKIKGMTQLLEEIWLHNPELRFNQLIYNLQAEYNTIYNNKNSEIVYMKEDRNGLITFIPKTDIDLFYTEDSDFTDFLYFYLGAIRKQEEKK